MKCPVCRSENIENYLKVNLISFLFPVPEKLLQKIKQEPFHLMICNKCSHIFQINIKKELTNIIYNEFYSHYNLDTSLEFQEVYRKRAINFIEKIIENKENQKALDIGCGEGTFFPFLEENGYKGYGIEPSKKALVAREKNPNAEISHEFFETYEGNIFNTKFDIILMNFVLEHIVDLESFFKKLQQYIKIGTKLIVQVPDIQYYIDNDVSLFYAHEHINYFTSETLKVLFERKGFEVIENKHGDSPSLLICGKYNGSEKIFEGENSKLVKKKKDFVEEKKELINKINQELSKSEKIILYGIGLQSFWVGQFCLESINLDKLELIDDNEYYKDKFVPLFNKKLKEFPKGTDFNNTLIFLTTSPAYHEKIKNKIKEKFKGDYKIAYIKDNNLIIE